MGASPVGPTQMPTTSVSTSGSPGGPVPATPNPILNPSSGSASATGGESSGGGKGVLCDGKLRTLDLYEAEEIHHLHIDRSQPDRDSALNVYFPKLINYTTFEFTDSEDGWEVYRDPNDGPKDISTYPWDQLKRLVTDRFSDIPEGQHLSLTHDATISKLRPNCEIVQILVIDGPGQQERDSNGWDGPPKKISRDLNYWKMLNPIDQAALILHEFLYDVQGLRSGSNSNDIRRLIGLVFSDQQLVRFEDPVFKAYLQGDFFAFPCGYPEQDQKPGHEIHFRPDPYSFQVIREDRDGKSGIGIYFDRLKGINLLFQASAFLPGITVKDANTAKDLVVRTKAESSIAGKTYNIEIHFHVTDFKTWAENTKDKARSDFSIRAWEANEQPPEFSTGACTPLAWDNMQNFKK